MSLLKHSFLHICVVVSELWWWIFQKETDLLHLPEADSKSRGAECRQSFWDAGDSLQASRTCMSSGAGSGVLKFFFVCSFYNSLWCLSMCCRAVTTPYQDAVSEDTLSGAAVDRHPQLLAQVVFLEILCLCCAFLMRQCVFYGHLRSPEMCDTLSTSAPF